MAKGAWLCSMVVLLALASTTVALYCWDSVLLQRGKAATCHPEQDTCFTVEFGRVAWKGCSKLKTWELAMTGEIGIDAILKGLDIDFSGIPDFEIKIFRRSFADKLFGKEDSSDEGLINVDCCSTDYCNIPDNIYFLTPVPDDKSTDMPNRIHVTNGVHVPDSTPVPDLPEITAEPDRSPMPNLPIEFVIECYNNATCKKQSKATFSKVLSDEDFDIVQSNATSSKVQSNEDFNMVQDHTTSDIPPNHATCNKMTQHFVLVLSFALYLICC